MAAGKIFAISFAISAAMNASFSTAMSRGSAAMQQLKEKTSLLNAEQKRLDRAWQESQNQIRMYSRQMQQLQTQYNQGKVSESQYQSSMQRIAQSMRSAGMSAEEYRGHLQRLRNEMQQTQNAAKRMEAAQAGKLAAKANLTNAFSGIQGSIATAGMVAAPFIGAIETAANFEQAMSKVQAITRSDSAAMKQLTDNARMLGETTQFSATQAAQAMSYLGMAGWDANQIIGGMPGLLALAAAGGTDLARTADIVSDDLTAFGLSADQAGHMADVFAVTVTRTNTNVEMLGETMKYAAPVAKAFGASMEETAALAGIMANSGIKASQAGTSLRAGFLRLAGPPKKSAKAMQELGISLSDAQAQQNEAREALDALGISMDDMSGKPKKMAAILTELKDKTAELGQEERLATLQKIFGTEAATGWLAVLDAGPEVFEKLVNEMEHSDGEAEKMAKTMMNNAKGAFTQFKSAVEGLAISFGTVFLPAITAGMKGMAEMAGRASAWVKENENLVRSFAEIGAGVLATVGTFKLFSIVQNVFRYTNSSVLEFIEKMRLSTKGQKALQIATQGQARAMQLLRTAMNLDLYRNLGTQAMGAFAKLRAITWASIGQQMWSGLSIGTKGIKDSFTGMRQATLATLQGMKTGIVNFVTGAAKAITGLPSRMANMARAAMTMWRAFSFAGVLNKVVTGFRVAGAAIQVFARASMAAAFSPLGIALMAIAGAALLIYNNWETVGPFFMSLWEQIQTAFSNAATMIQPAIDQFITACQNLATAVMPVLESLWQTIQNAWSQIMAVFAENSGTIDTVINIFVMLAEVVGVVLVGAFVGFVSTSVGVMTAFIGSIASIVTGIIGVLTGIIEFVTGVFTGNWSQAWQGVVDIFSSIFNTLSGIANSVLGGIMNTVNSIANAVKSIHFGGGGGGSEIAANAEGGIYRKGAFLTTFAEDSAEAAIPLDGSPRAIGLWQKAGEILGIGKANKTANASMEKKARPVTKSEPQATMQVVSAQIPQQVPQQEVQHTESTVVQPVNVETPAAQVTAIESPGKDIQNNVQVNVPNPERIRQEHKLESRVEKETFVKEEATKLVQREKESLIKEHETEKTQPVAETPAEVIREHTTQLVQQRPEPSEPPAVQITAPNSPEVIEPPAQVVQAEATPVKVEQAEPQIVQTAPQVVQAKPQDVNVRQQPVEPQVVKVPEQIAQEPPTKPVVQVIEPENPDVIEPPTQIVQAEATPVDVEQAAPQIVQAPPQDLNINQQTAEAQIVKPEVPAVNVEQPEQTAPTVNINASKENAEPQEKAVPAMPQTMEMEHATPLSMPPISITLNFYGNDNEPSAIRRAVEKAGRTVQRTFAEQYEQYKRECERFAFD